MINKENLDKRICDVVKGATNTQTYREYIKKCEGYFRMPEADLEIMNDLGLKRYLECVDFGMNE